MTLLKYEHIKIRDSGEPLVDLSNFDFLLEPSYYTRDLSKDSRIYIRKTIAEKLETIQKKLANYKFKIWDGWRSREVQHNIYMDHWKNLNTEHPDWKEDRLKEEVGKFVTVANDPNRIPIHVTGGSIDLTLVDSSGNELDMGTGFDHFGPEAASFFYEINDINDPVRANRKFLREAMVAEHFRFDDDEWWHFDYGNQLWAVALNKTYAIYGECAPPDK
jgi:D-alanyl-D-alanine dipeptidase